MKAGITEGKRENRISTIMVYMTAVLFIVLGIIFLTVKGLQVEHLCYLLAVCLILFGIIRIGEYFIRECYRNVNQYGFSIGVFAIILGVCVIVRVQQFTEIFNLCLGIGILLTAIIKVQNAMDLRALEDRGFPVFLILAVLMVICAAVILINPFHLEETRNRYTYIIMIIDGILAVISTTYLIVKTKTLQKYGQPEGCRKKDIQEEGITQPELSGEEQHEEEI